MREMHEQTKQIKILEEQKINEITINQLTNENSQQKINELLKEKNTTISSTN